MARKRRPKAADLTNSGPVAGYVAAPAGATRLPAGTPVFGTSAGASIYGRLHLTADGWVVGVWFEAGDLIPVAGGVSPFVLIQPFDITGLPAEVPYAA